MEDSWKSEKTQLFTYMNTQMNTCFLKKTEQKSTKQQHPASCICKRAFLNICPTFYQSPDPLSTERSLHFWATGPGKDHLKAGTAQRAELVLTPDAIFMGQHHLVPKAAGAAAPAAPGRGRERRPSPRRSRTVPAALGSALPAQESSRPRTWHCKCLGAWFFFPSPPSLLFLSGKGGPVRTLPHLSLVGPSSRKNANPILYMQIFAADLRAVGKKSLFKKALFK